MEAAPNPIYARILQNAIGAGTARPPEALNEPVEEKKKVADRNLPKRETPAPTPQENEGENEGGNEGENDE